MIKSLFYSVLILFSCNIFGQTTSFQWARSFGDFEEYVTSVKTDQSGNVYTVGYFSDTLDFDPGVSTFTMCSSSPNSFNGFISKLDASGNFLWAKRITGSSQIQSLAIDLNGNLLLTGNFGNISDFDPGVNTYTLSSSYGDVFVLKLDANGNFIWVKCFSGNLASNQGLGIATDGLGNVYTTGFFRNTVDFDPGPNTYTLNCSNVQDVFISKLNATGDFVWAKSIDCPGGVDRGTGIDVDHNFNVYITGWFLDVGDFDPGVGSFILSSLNGSSSFILKLNSLGNFVWAKGFGDTNLSQSKGHSISVDNDGNIITVGDCNGITDFISGSGSYTTSIPSTTAFYVHKLDSLGNFQWVNCLYGDLYSYARPSSICHDLNNNLYVTGISSDTIDIDPGITTYTLKPGIFISKYNSNGNFVWAKGIENNISGISFIDIRNTGEIYISGEFGGTTDFNTESGIFNLTSNYFWDIFILKLQQDATGLYSVEAINNNAKAFPNPANDQLFIHCNDNSQIKLYDMLGEIILSEKNINDNYSINVKGMKAGIYFLEIKEKTNSEFIRIIID